MERKTAKQILSSAVCTVSRCHFFSAGPGRDPKLSPQGPAKASHSTKHPPGFVKKATLIARFKRAMESDVQGEELRRFGSTGILLTEGHDVVPRFQLKIQHAAVHVKFSGLREGENTGKKKFSSCQEEFKMEVEEPESHFGVD